MATEGQSTGFEALVLKDTAGDYYLLPREILEQAKVPAEQKAEIERLAPDLARDVSAYTMTSSEAIYLGHLLLFSCDPQRGVRYIQAGVRAAQIGGVVGPM